MILFSVMVVSSRAPAQAGMLAGAVVDSAGSAISGAEVTVVGTGASTVSGERGEFRMAGVRTGSVYVRARRLGFRPDSTRVDLTELGVDGVKVRLGPVARALDPVTVRANRINFTGRLAGYYQRLDRRSSGYFITRAQIDGENSRTLSQLLQHAPGMSAFRGRAGAQGIRMRGRNCWPLVWLDGSPMPSGEVDLESISPSTLHGIELYLGSTTAPTRYSATRGLSSCGTILLWSRGPDTDPIQSRRGSPNLETLVASLTIFTADKVDSQATLNASRPLGVPYPPELFAEKIPGSVVAEFVVDAEGRVEVETFGIISSSHRLFSDAVKTAVDGAQYKPAVKGGRRVRQVVHQPFAFTPPR